MYTLRKYDLLNVCVKRGIYSRTREVVVGRVVCRLIARLIFDFKPNLFQGKIDDWLT
jgi:hypothetical protein